MTNAENIADEYNRLNVLRSEVDKLKKEYKIVKERFDNGMVTEEEKKAKGQLLLKTEYDYQKLKDKISQQNGTYTSPKIGEWTITKTRFEYRRVKVLQDEDCGWK